MKLTQNINISQLDITRGDSSKYIPEKKKKPQSYKTGQLIKIEQTEPAG